MDFKPIYARKLSCRIPIGLGLICLMLLVGLPVENTFGGDIKTNTSSCSALAELSEGGFVIEKAEIVPAGPLPGPGGNSDPLPEHCLVQGILNPRTGAAGQKFGIGFDLRMPTNWNKRFFFQGGGGLDGVLAPAIGNLMGAVKPSALARGFAVVSTDGGHRSSMLDG
jgi:Tannase and feruloyl esterase